MNDNKDPNRIIRLLPLFIGGLGGILLLVNRFTTIEIFPSQSRSDALGIIESALLILVGLLWQQVQPRTPDVVQLIGQEKFELAADLPDDVKTELAWASHLLLTNTVTKSIVIYHRERVLLERGILSDNFSIKYPIKIGAILQRVLEKQQSVYLVNLNLYPAKIEFDYLPENTQGLVCQPIGNKGVLILGANAPRSYTKQDERWIAGIADKLAETLDRRLS
jgi:Cofactor assembly of complex C subunit B, CCB2/CCB4